MPLSSHFSIACLLLTSMALSGCQAQNVEQGPPPPPKVTVAKPIKKQIVQWDAYTGRLEAVDEVEVRARLSGYLQTVHFQEGQMVEEGQLLFVIDQRPYIAALNGAKAALKEAESNLRQAHSLVQQREAEKVQAKTRVQLAEKQYKRITTLNEQGVITQDELDVSETELLQSQADLAASQATIDTAVSGVAAAEAAIETAKANVEQAVLDLTYTRVVAPITGRISELNVTSGNLISGGTSDSTLLTTIVSMDPVHCAFDASEQDLLNYARLDKSGERVSSRTAKHPVYMALIDEEDFEHLGHMDFVDNQVDRQTGTIRGRAIFRNPGPDYLLTPGLFAQIRIPGSGQYEAVLIPDFAIATDQSEKYVFTVDENNTVRRQPIETGALSHGLRIIRSGLTGDETLIIEGLQRVRPEVIVQTETRDITSLVKDQSLPDYYEPVAQQNWISKPPAPEPQPLQVLQDVTDSQGNFPSLIHVKRMDDEPQKAASNREGAQ